MYQLFILPEYQGKGIGKTCMMKVISDAKHLNLPIGLQVLKVNPRAAAFYRRLGFIEAGTSETHIEMQKPL